MATSQEWMPANKKQDQNGWYPKLAVKIACQKKCIPAKIGCQPKATTSQMLVQAKSCYQPKNGCQPNVAASQKQLTAKCQCKLKSCRNTGNDNWHKIIFFAILAFFKFRTLAATLGFSNCVPSQKKISGALLLAEQGSWCTLLESYRGGAVHGHSCNGRNWTFLQSPFL